MNEKPAAEAARPLLSLCLATYNRARYLDRYLTHHLTALETAGLDYELVVSDNCSTDETPQILEAFAARHPRLRVSRQPRNVGAYPNILTTLHQARGEVVVSISDDDLAVPHQLIAFAQRMAAEPDLMMIQAPWVLVDETRDGAIIGKFYDFEGEHRFGRGDYGGALAFVLEHHAFPECWLMRRSALPAIAGAVPRFTYSYFCMLA
ncbi:MAG: glycosyltransferase family 2 protein, partial [Phenylobacterium sp.]